MQSVNYAESHKQARYVECRYAECRNAECHYTELLNIVAPLGGQQRTNTLCQWNNRDISHNFLNSFHNCKNCKAILSKTVTITSKSGTILTTVHCLRNLYRAQ
jgi:hypothetical protein